MGGSAPQPSSDQKEAEAETAALAKQQLDTANKALAEQEHERQAGYLGYQTLFGSAGYNTPLGNGSLLGSPQGK